MVYVCSYSLCSTETIGQSNFEASNNTFYSYGKWIHQHHHILMTTFSAFLIPSKSILQALLSLHLFQLWFPAYKVWIFYSNALFSEWLNSVASNSNATFTHQQKFSSSSLGFVCVILIVLRLILMGFHCFRRISLIFVKLEGITLIFRGYLCLLELQMALKPRFS